MQKIKAYAASAARAPIAPTTIERRDPRANDIVIDIAYCGICHSDIHQARDEWGGATFPMVPGHEIVGRVSQVGAKVTKFKVGDIAGVGCFVDSCRECSACREGDEQFCEKGGAFTYNSKEMDKVTPTQGGYSQRIVVDENYGLHVSPKLPLERVAPLLCAGITTYSPLKRFGAGPGKKVGIVGLGGLGHMGVKIAAAMGAEVTVFSTSPKKEADAKKLGAQGFVVTKDPANFEKIQGKFDIILDTVSAEHDYGPYLASLKRRGTMIVVGVPEKEVQFHPYPLIGGNKTLAGSMIGGIRETQEMLDFCAKHGIGSDVEVIPAEKINEAYERTIKADVRYRFVIDTSTL